MKNAAYFRAKARAALKGHWGIAILALLLAGLCGAFESSSNSNVDLEDTFGVTAKDLANPNFFTAENLRAILAKFTPEVLVVLLTGTLFVFLFSVAWRLFVGAPVRVGYEKFNLGLIDAKQTPAPDGEEHPTAAVPKIGTLFDAFKTGYIKAVGTRVLLFLIALAYSLPMIASGVVCAIFTFPIINAYSENAMEALTSAQLVSFTISSIVFTLVSIGTAVLLTIVSLRYSCAYMILAEYPETSAVDALRKSRTLMHGNKWRLFCLNLSFIGWYLLAGFFSCGIGLLWAIPYSCVAQTAFYDEIANRRAAREAEFPSLDPNDYFGVAPTDFQ